MSKNKFSESDFRVSVLSPDSSEPWISALCFPLAQSRLGCSSAPGLVCLGLYHPAPGRHVTACHPSSSSPLLMGLCIWFVSARSCLCDSWWQVSIFPSVGASSSAAAAAVREPVWAGPGFLLICRSSPGLAWAGPHWGTLEAPWIPGPVTEAGQEPGLGSLSGSLTLYHGHSVVIS